jgi:hypothetical protein
LVIDFKMKFEERSARETTKEHYGKRGMSWHGCLIMYFERIKVKTKEGKTVWKTVRKNVYLDQIVNNGNEQTSGMVMSLLEAAIKWIAEFLPFIKNIVVQSDNAKCYQSNLLRQFIAVLNTKSQVKVVRYIFTETQDGKGTCVACIASCSSFALVPECDCLFVVAVQALLMRTLHVRWHI